jgi:hypothetical protein
MFRENKFVIGNWRARITVVSEFSIASEERMSATRKNLQVSKA